MRFTARMTLDEFKIGTPFRCSEKLYLCTNVGTRTVAAIRIDQVETAVLAMDGVMSQNVLTFEAGQREGWFSGPPYAVAEIVFDEYDFEVCEPAPGLQINP